VRVQAAALLIALILALLAIIFAVSGVAAPPGAASRLPTDTPLTSFLPALGGAPRRRRDTVRYGLVTGAALLCNTMHALFFHHVARSLHWRKTRRRLEATESASFFDLCVGMLLATQDTELTQNPQCSVGGKRTSYLVGSIRAGHPVQRRRCLSFAYFSLAAVMKRN